MATKGKSTDTFAGLRCPYCGDTDTIDIDVSTLILSCRECGEEITHAEIDRTISKWIRLFNWIVSATEG